MEILDEWLGGWPEDQSINNEAGSSEEPFWFQDAPDSSPIPQENTMPPLEWSLDGMLTPVHYDFTSLSYPVLLSNRHPLLDDHVPPPQLSTGDPHACDRKTINDQQSTQMNNQSTPDNLSHFLRVPSIPPCHIAKMFIEQSTAESFNKRKFVESRIQEILRDAHDYWKSRNTRDSMKRVLRARDDRDALVTACTAAGYLARVVSGEGSDVLVVRKPHSRKVRWML